jgi:hypothetical protein
MKHFYELTEMQQKKAIEHVKEIAKTVLYDANIFEQQEHKQGYIDRIALMAAEGSSYSDDGVLEQFPRHN